MQDDGVFNVMTPTPAYASILESAVGDEQQNTQSDHYLVEPSKSSVYTLYMSNQEFKNKDSAKTSYKT